MAIENEASESLEDELNEIREAFDKQFSNTAPALEMRCGWVLKTYPEYVIVCSDDIFYKVGFTHDEATDVIVFDEPAKWIQVERQETWEEAIKAGARHSAGDQAAIQAAHDAIAKVGAVCDPSNSMTFTKSTMTMDYTE